MILYSIHFFVFLIGMSLCIGSAHAVTLINNSLKNMQVTVNGHSATLKAQAIVDYAPPKLKIPLQIVIIGTKQKNKSFRCQLTRYQADIVVVLPDECQQTR